MRGGESESDAGTISGPVGGNVNNGASSSDKYGECEDDGQSGDGGAEECKGVDPSCDGGVEGCESVGPSDSEPRSLNMTSVFLTTMGTTTSSCVSQFFRTTGTAPSTRLKMERVRRI